jgi:copper chaperone CopZ
MTRTALALAILLLPVFLNAGTITLSGVHLCCKGCIKGVEKAAESAGATATADHKTNTVSIESKDEDTAKKAVAALAQAGYYGKSSYAPISIQNTETDKKVSSATVSGVHLCCRKCAKAIDHVVENLKGATEHTATSQAKSFKIKGDFTLKALQEALHAQGLHGKISE